MSRQPPMTIDEALAKAKKARKLGDPKRAAELYAAILRQNPGHPVAKKGLKKLERALKAKAARIRETNPAPAEVDPVIGMLASERLAEAEQAARDLFRRFPRSVIVLNLLGVALQRQSKLDDAVKAFDDAIRFKPDFPEAHCNRGIALKERGDFGAAVDSYDAAIRIRPDYAEAWFNRGNVLKDTGRFDEAIDSFEQAIRSRPEFASAHRNLSALKTFTADDPRIPEMRRLLEDSSMGDGDRAELAFALGKALDDAGDHEGAYAGFELGNRLRKAEIGYDIESDRQLFGRLKSLFDTVPEQCAGDTDRGITPVFIVGMMRSGTTLVEQILASHSRVHGAGELEAMNGLVMPLLSEGSDAIGEKALTSIRDAYLETLASFDVEEDFITDKMPLNFRWLGFICSALPEAKIVHVERDPVATCWSIYRHYFPAAGNGYACSQTDLVEYYGLYRDLMTFWRERYPERMLDLGYESLTENQEAETRRLLEFVGLEFEPACLDFHETKRAVATSSATQVRQQLYRGSSGAWRRYEKHLGTLIEGLGGQ